MKLKDVGTLFLLFLLLDGYGQRRHATALMIHQSCLFRGLYSARNRSWITSSLGTLRFTRISSRRRALMHNADDTGNDHAKTQAEEQSILQRKRNLLREFLTIGGPALIQLAAEPLASLVDTAYLGRLGPDVLGGAGVAVSAQYAVSKLYNDPLLRTSISLVAAQDGQSRETDTANDKKNATTPSSDTPKSKVSVAVSSALLLAAAVGVIQMVVYAIFCKGITMSMGLTPNSSMWHSAVSYLQIRALGTPAATMWLVTNGIFRGLGDTRTPLIYSLLFTILNIILDPLFIFVFGWGASGAAAGTALAQYTALIPLLWALHRTVPIDIVGQWSSLRSSLRQYLTAGGLVLVRTFGKVLAYAVCARKAALLGSVAAAAYNLTFQLGYVKVYLLSAHWGYFGQLSELPSHRFPF